MNKKTKFILAVASALLASCEKSETTAPVEMEKCYGIAKAGKNDCKSKNNLNSCAGQQKIDNDPNNFITVPKGECIQKGGKLE